MTPVVDLAAAPQRIQRKRSKGWTAPPNSVYVGRPTVWGNPFHFSCRISTELRRKLVEQHRRALCGGALVGERIELERYVKLHGWQGGFDALTPRSFLRGKNLMCWCRLDQPCHADTLLELANA